MVYFKCGGSSTLDGLTDVDISSPTNGQILKYNSTTQKWENADEGGSSQRTYLGQLIERVSAADSRITSSGKTQYNGGENWKAFDGVESSSGIENCWAADENNTSAYIQYHFDSPYYFTQLILKLYSHYGGAWTGNINILGSNDGVTWTNISSTGQAVSVTASLNAMNTETIDLDDTETWKYIRVQADGQAFNVPYQPCCDFGEIYVYGGEEISGGGSDIVIVRRTDNTNGYAWLIPCDANGNALKPSEVTLLSIFAEADMSGAPPYYNGLNICVDTDADRYCCKLYNTQAGGYAPDGTYSVDYTVAYIPNGGGSSGGGSSSHTYSTTEQKVGTWIDGSDIYEKSFEVTITQSSNPIIEQDASYIDALISYDAVVKNSLGYISGVGMDASGWGFALHRNPSMQLLLFGNVSEAIGGKAYVTIRYTKVSTS